MIWSGRCWRCQVWYDGEKCPDCGYGAAYGAGTACGTCGTELVWTRLRTAHNRSGVGIVDPALFCPQCGPEEGWAHP